MIKETKILPNGQTSSFYDSSPSHSFLKIKTPLLTVQERPAFFPFAKLKKTTKEKTKTVAFSPPLSKKPFLFYTRDWKPKVPYSPFLLKILSCFFFAPSSDQEEPTLYTSALRLFIAEGLMLDGKPENCLLFLGHQMHSWTARRLWVCMGGWGWHGKLVLEWGEWTAGSKLSVSATWCDDMAVSHGPLVTSWRHAEANRNSLGAGKELI